MNREQKIKTLLITKIREKLHNYNPETDNMPFHYRLLGKDRMALYSFVHSVSTSLGQSIFEQVAVILAESLGHKAHHQYNLEGYISDKAVLVIDGIERGLKSCAQKPNSEAEFIEVEAVSQSGDLGKIQKKKVDIFIESDDAEFYFELKTAKPNIAGFESVKKQLLQWVALRTSKEKPAKKIHTIVAIPYNPYEPKPYSRWTLQGLFDLEKEVKVGQEFWDLVGGEGSYEKLLTCFEQAGVELYDEIDQKMNSLKNKK